jgi:hypothetical protein
MDSALEDVLANTTYRAPSNLGYGSRDAYLEAESTILQSQGYHYPYLQSIFLMVTKPSRSHLSRSRRAL